MVAQSIHIDEKNTTSILKMREKSPYAQSLYDTALLNISSGQKEGDTGIKLFLGISTATLSIPPDTS